MNKNTVIGVILIAIILMWWMASAPRPQQVPPQNGPAPTEAEPATLEVPAEAKPGEVLLGGAPLPEVVKLEGDSAVADSAADSTAIVKKPPEPRDFKVETDRFVVTLSNVGAKIKSVVAKTLADSAGNFPELIQDSAAGALTLSLDGVNLDKVVFAPADSVPDFKAVEDSFMVAFSFRDAAGREVVRTYSFTKEGQAIGQKNFFRGFKPNRYELAWNGGMRETEPIPKGKNIGANYFFSEVAYNASGSVEREIVSDKETFNDEHAKILWAGLRRKYIAMTLQFEDPGEAKIVAEHFGKEENNPGTYKLTVKDDLYADTLAYSFMVLPLEWSLLQSFDVGYEKIIVSGWRWCAADVWFVAICHFLLWLLNLLFSIIPNYGVAIILITILVRSILTPLTLKQLRSSKEMAKLKPELDEINVKYRSDPQKRQAAMMELYTKRGINPLSSCTGGCLPMLIQMPVFFALFFVLGRSIELRGQPFFGWISDLSRSDVIFSGISIPYLMPQGIAVLPFVMIVTTYFQTKQSMTAMTDPAQQKMMTWMMPAMMFLFSAVMPSGLVLYWIVSNIWGIVQYKIIHRDDPPAKKANVKDAEIVSKKKK